MSRILLVEEGRDAASVLLDELHRAGHEVDHIDDGAVALHRILTSPPALTLLDVQLPHVNGLQILEKIRARSDHPIIMLTALAHEADRLRGFELGADDYVCKPFSPREVVVRIHTVLRRYAQRRIVARPSVPITFGAVRGCAILDGHYLPPDAPRVAAAARAFAGARAGADALEAARSRVPGGARRQRTRGRHPHQEPQKEARHRLDRARLDPLGVSPVREVARILIESMRSSS